MPLRKILDTMSEIKEQNDLKSARKFKKLSALNATQDSTERPQTFQA